MANESAEGEIDVSLMTTYVIGEIIISCLAVLGNSAIIIAFVVHRRLRTIQNCYIVSLAMTDFSMGFFSIPFVLITLDGTRPESKELCLLMLTVVVLIDLCSIFSVLALTVDRFYAVSCPFKYHAKMTSCRAILHISAAWLVPLGVASVVPLGWNNLGDDGFHDCTFAHIVSMKYYTALYFLCFIPLFLVMCRMYSRIFRIIQGQLKALEELQAIGARLNQQASNRTDDRYPTQSHNETPSLSGAEARNKNGHSKEEDREETGNRSKPSRKAWAKESDGGTNSGTVTVRVNESNAPAQSETGNLKGTVSVREVNEGPITGKLVTISASVHRNEMNPVISVPFCQGSCRANVCGERIRQSPSLHGLQNDVNHTYLSRELNEKAYQRFHRIRSERRTALLFLFIMVFLFISWSPIYIVDVFLAFGVDVSQSVINFAVLLSHFNSAMNPFLYGYKSEFRWFFKQWLFGIYSRCCRICVKNMVAPSMPNHGDTNTVY